MEEVRIVSRLAGPLVVQVSAPAEPARLAGPAGRGG